MKNAPIDKLRAGVRAEYRDERGPWAQEHLKPAHPPLLTKVFARDAAGTWHNTTASYEGCSFDTTCGKRMRCDAFRAGAEWVSVKHELMQTEPHPPVLCLDCER